MAFDTSPSWGKFRSQMPNMMGDMANMIGRENPMLGMGMRGASQAWNMINNRQPKLQADPGIVTLPSMPQFGGTQNTFPNMPSTPVGVNPIRMGTPPSNPGMGMGGDNTNEFVSKTQGRMPGLDSGLWGAYNNQLTGMNSGGIAGQGVGQGMNRPYKGLFY